jgi:hypothetical protein
LPHLTTNLKRINIEVKVGRDSETNLSRIEIRIIPPIPPKPPISPGEGENHAGKQTTLTGQIGDITPPGQIPPTISPSSDRAQSGGPEISEILSEDDILDGLLFSWLENGDGNGKRSKSNPANVTRATITTTIQKTSTEKYAIIPQRFFACQHSGCTSYFSDPLQLLEHIRIASHGDEQQMRWWLEMRGLIDEN